LVTSNALVVDEGEGSVWLGKASEYVHRSKQRPKIEEVKEKERGVENSHFIHWLERKKMLNGDKTKGIKETRGRTHLV